MVLRPVEERTLMNGGNSRLVADLRATVVETVARVLAGRRVAAVVDFPDYANPGDSAIFLGQLSCLRKLGHPIPYSCPVSDYEADTLAAEAGDGAILLSGGGNFGDLWPRVHTVREDILRRFRDRAIVQLPQSLHFGSPDALRNTRRLIADHPDFTLLVRDRASLEVARTEFGPRSWLCPDMAFALTGLRRYRQPVRDILWLDRTDHERDPSQPRNPDAVDWADEPSTLLRRVNRRLSQSLRDRRTPLLRWSLAATFEPLAGQRVRRAVRLLSSARVVVTNRLHGHILCTMLGTKHVVLDDRNGKISSFHAQWTRDAAGVTFVESGSSAIAAARALLSAPPPSPSPSRATEP
ncbi:MAG: polysaccharide pyruvyl transferase family protein [Gemmatimonadota bacterium]